MAIGFTVACKRFFGSKPGQSLAEFAMELKALTPGDRQELTPLLEQALGEKISPETVNPER